MVKCISLAAACFAGLWGLNAFGTPVGAAPGDIVPGAASPGRGAHGGQVPFAKTVPGVKTLKQTTPVNLVPAQDYIASLRQIEQKLGDMEKSGDRTYGAARRLLPPSATIRRNDGQSQSAAQGDFQKVLAPKGNSANLKPGDRLTRREIRLLRDNIVQRRRSLEDWVRPHDGNYYQDTDAKRIIKQLETSGQIRTGPTAAQQFWSDLRKWFRELIDKISKFLFGNTRKSPVKVPSIDPNVLRFVFYSAVFSLLVAIAYFLWKALGGRWKRSEAQRRVRYLEGEDAELLRLPPDELRERAARFAAEGNYREALRHLYIAVLVKFDARGVWRYDTRRTNWEHIQALRNDQTRVGLVVPMVELTRRFDRVRYGDAPASQIDWQRFETDVRTVDSLLDKGQFNANTPQAGEVRR